MPGKPGKPREPPGGQRAASGREEPASAIVSLRSPPLSRGDGALFGTSAYLQNHRRVFTATLPGAFCLPTTTTTGAAGTTQPPRPPFGEQLPPQGPCLRRDERMLPKRLLETTTMEPMGRCLLQGPLSVQQMRERAYREDWRAAGTLWRLQECNRVGGDLSFRL